MLESVPVASISFAAFVYMLKRARLFSILTELEMAAIADTDLRRAARVASTLRTIARLDKHLARNS